MKSSNIGRVLTLLIEIKDDKVAEWIWKNHASGDDSNGICVNGISNGNMFDEVDKLEKEIEILGDKLFNKNYP